MDTADLVRGLSVPDAYVPAPRDVEFRQTHISLLFFAGERVYKVKKPVNLGFLDFTTAELRRHFCEEEVRLNRRLAPRVYLGVVPVVRGTDGRVRIGGQGEIEGEIVDWAVEMVRLPEARMLESLLDRGEIDNGLLNTLVSLLAGFHARAATGSEVDEHGTPEAVRRNCEENFEQIRSFVGSSLTAEQGGFLADRCRTFLASHDDQLRSRVAEGRIREGHGDLHAGNICCTAEGIVAYDCIEFSRRFRCGDVACDLAFLAMDLDDRGFPGFSRYLVHRYSTEAGDPELPTLVDFYKSYRAVVRGKVAAMTAADPAVGADEREEHVRRSMRYFQLAASYDLPRAIVLTCGLPASGKSFLARHFARSLRATLLSSDVRRKVLAGIQPGARAHEAYGAGLYAQDMKERTYRSLLEDAVAALESGHSVVVDATFSRKGFREPFAQAAGRLRVPCFVAHVTAAEDLVRERMTQRAREAGSASDADFEIYLRERAAFEPPDEFPAGSVVDILSGTDPPERQSSLLIDRMIVAERGT